MMDLRHPQKTYLLLEDSSFFLQEDTASKILLEPSNQLTTAQTKVARGTLVTTEG